MAVLKYKINGYWHEIQIMGHIEAASYTNTQPQQATTDSPPDLGVTTGEAIKTNDKFGRQ